VGPIIRKSRKDSAIGKGGVNLAENRILQVLIEYGPGQTGQDGIWTGNLFAAQVVAQLRGAALDNAGIGKFARNFLCQDGAFFDGREMRATRQVRENMSGERPAAGPKLNNARGYVQIRRSHHFLGQKRR